MQQLPGHLFAGFSKPEANFFRLPNEWTDITAKITSLAEMKVVEYVLKHTWGYSEFDVVKKITTDEFMYGRKRKDGTRIDEGTGLSKPSIIAGLNSAVEHGLLTEEVDESDKARIKKFYKLKRPCAILAKNLLFFDDVLVALNPMHTPAPATNVFIPKKPEHQPPAARKHSSKRQTVKLTIWLKRPVYEEIQRIAGHAQMSLSKIGATALEEWVHQRISQQHETLLYPIIRQIIREELRSFGNRIVFFLMRIAFAAEQSRILITNILDRVLRLLNAPEQTFTTLVDQSNKMAQRNIINKSPQIRSLIDEWEGSFRDPRKEGSRLNG